MKADDVVVLHIAGEAEFADHYLIGVLRDRPATDPPLWLDVVDNDRDRKTAFHKARKQAAGRDVFFTRRGQPGHLQDHYNLIPCPKCGIYTRGLETLTLDNGAQSVRCPACEHSIRVTIREP